jgi:hypothetical protein
MSPLGGLGHGEAAEATGCPDNQEPHSPKLLPRQASTRKDYRPCSRVIGMLSGMVSGRTRYSQALGAFDQAAILASLSDDVTIRVAVHDEPLRGKDTASFLFGVLTQELAPFELTEEIVEGTKSVILFETSLHGRRAHGLNVVGYQPDGLVGELTVFFRPLAAMQLVAEVIGGHMAQRFGPPPEGLR